MASAKWSACTRSLPARSATVRAIRRMRSWARARQRERFGGDGSAVNGRMTGRLIRKHCVLDEECQGLLKASVNELGLSARAHDKILRLARTIADLAANERILPDHISEAINYRMLDRNLWK